MRVSLLLLMVILFYVTGLKITEVILFTLNESTRTKLIRVTEVIRY